MHLSPAITAFALTLCGCSLALAPGEQCGSNDDCAARGFAGAVCEQGFCRQPAVAPSSPWACLGHVTKPHPDPTNTLTMPLTLHHVDRTPVTDATVDVCDKLDIECDGTDARYPKGLHPNAKGEVTTTAPEGFDGFFRIAGPKLMATRLYVGQPLVEPPNINAFQVVEATEFQTIVAYAKLTFDPTRGAAIFFVEDCAKHSASGASFSCVDADDESKVFYLVNQLPVLPPKATSTDPYGFGGYVNLPVGATVAQARLESTGELIGQVGFGVFANTLSYVLITPGPT